MEGNIMTGAQHYTEAEQFGAEQTQVQVALVHATLALAAATAISGDNADYADHSAWTEAAGEPRQKCSRSPATVPSLFRQTSISSGKQREPASSESAGQTV